MTVTVDGGGWLAGHPLETEVCEPRVVLDAGTHLIEGAATEVPLTVDRVVLRDRVERPVAALDGGPTATVLDGGPTATVLERGRRHRTIEIGGCPEGCWLVLGEGHSVAWQATHGDRSLGPPVPVQGGFNGWWVEPTDHPIVVELRWTAQWGFTLAAIGSLATALACVALIVVATLTRRRSGDAQADAPPHAPPAAPRPELITELAPLTLRRSVIVGVVWSALTGLLIAPEWAVVGAASGACMVVVRRGRLPELSALATLVTVGAAVTWLERADSPLPNGLWPARFERLHEWAMFAVVGVLCGALTASDASIEADTDAVSDADTRRPGQLAD